MTSSTPSADRLQGATPLRRVIGVMGTLRWWIVAVRPAQRRDLRRGDRADLDGGIADLTRRAGRLHRHADTRDRRGAPVRGGTGGGPLPGALRRTPGHVPDPHPGAGLVLPTASNHSRRRRSPMHAPATCSPGSSTTSRRCRTSRCGCSHHHSPRCWPAASARRCSGRSNPTLAAALIAFMVLTGVVLPVSTRRLGRAAAEVVTTRQAVINSVAVESVDAIAELAAYGREDLLGGRLAALTDERRTRRTSPRHATGAAHGARDPARRSRRGRRARAGRPDGRRRASRRRAARGRAARCHRELRGDRTARELLRALRPQPRRRTPAGRARRPATHGGGPLRSTTC